MINEDNKKTVLIIGAGFAGCTAAYLLRENGFKVTVLEKEEFPGGGCRTSFYGGHPHTLGPRIFFTKDRGVISFLTEMIKIRNFCTKTWTYVANDGRFYNYPIFAKDLLKMPDRQEINKQLRERKDKKPNLKNFESYWLDAVGPSLYYKFIDDYSKKMWGIKSNKLLSADFNWVNRGTPIRQKDTRLYNDMFQGYPELPDGYNQFFEKALKGCKFLPNCTVDYFDVKKRRIYSNMGQFGGEIIINTISLDNLFGGKYGHLKYCGRKMLKIILPAEKILPKDIVWIHYAGQEPFTRVTEFKKITNYASKDTLLGVEIPTEEGQHYPLQTKNEIIKFKKYQKIFPENFYSIGRLGSFSYKGIPDVIREGMNTVELILKK